MRVVKIEKEKYTGKVHNLEVKEDHSYAGEGIFYHNCDDILADPKNPLNLAVINQITHIFFEDVMSLPQEGGELHLAGTPQSDDDLFFQIKSRGRIKSDLSDGFLWRKEPAIINNVTKEVVWQNLFSYPRLMEIKAEILDKAFNKEYMCAPTRAEEGYFTRAELEELVVLGKNMGLEYQNHMNTDNEVVAGWDLGKKRHPAHFSVFERVGNILVQRYEVFWDGVDYTRQFGKILKMKERMGIDRVGFDSTRGEFELLIEQGKLPAWFEPIVFNKKQNASMAKALESRVVTKTMALLDNPRQINVMLQMGNDLKAAETDEGHGDSFWTNAIASWLAEQPKDSNPSVYISMDDDEIDIDIDMDMTEFDRVEEYVW